MAQPACTLVSPPATELLTLTQVKDFLRIDSDFQGDDALLNDEIAAARQRFERVTGRAALTTTYRLTLDQWPCGWLIYAPRTPLKEVVSVVYTAVDATETTLATDQYVVDTDSVPGRIYPTYNVSWPALQWAMNAVKVTFRAGHATAEEIPDAAEIRNRMRACVAYCWRYREDRDEMKLDALFASLSNGVL